MFVKPLSPASSLLTLPTLSIFRAEHLALPPDAMSGHPAVSHGGNTLEMSPLIPKAKDSVITLDYVSHNNSSGI